jgi:hypothetical protein
MHAVFKHAAVCARHACSVRTCSRVCAWHACSVRACSRVCAWHACSVRTCSRVCAWHSCSVRTCSRVCSRTSIAPCSQLLRSSSGSPRSITMHERIGWPYGSRSGCRCRSAIRRTCSSGAITNGQTAHYFLLWVMLGSHSEALCQSQQPCRQCTVSSTVPDAARPTGPTCMGACTPCVLVRQ